MYTYIYIYIYAHAEAGAQHPDSRRAADSEPEATRDWYVVVAERAIVRREPDVNSLMENFKVRGSVVQLFEWDETRQWRKCLEASTQYGFPGWMKLDHPQHGASRPLLRRLELLCVAAMRNDVEQLRLCVEGRKLRGWRGPGSATRKHFQGEDLHRHSKAFEEHTFKNMNLIVSLRSNIYRTSFGAFDSCASGRVAALPPRPVDSSAN